MKNRVVWLMVTGWMVATLLLASCAPAVVKEEAEKVAPPVREKEGVVVPKTVEAPKTVGVPGKEANLVKWTGVKQDGTVVEKMIEKPRYGGVLIMARPDQPTAFDDAGLVSTGASLFANHIVQETLLTRDWTKGPIGTNEWSAQHSTYPAFNLETGLLAESWEVLDNATLVYHIRKGVYWQDKSPVNGRELTAADVVFSTRRNYTIGFQNRSETYRVLTDLKDVTNSIYISPTDKWAMVVKNQPGTWGSQTIGSSAVINHIIAPETVGGVIAKDKVITDWKMMVGTGPFMLKEYVGASSLTYVRNPTYWRHDPFFPENQLPYVDTFKVLIIPDMSTRMAALRTGRVDTQFSAEGISAEDAESLMKTNPELQWASFLGGGTSIRMRVDKPELPFYDVKVRRALMTAINYQELANVYYGGKAVIFDYPVQTLPEFMTFYIPLEKMPESVQELYGYHPDKARQLLAEAGYPQGFKTEVLVWQAEHVNLFSIIKEYWAKIGVDLKIDVKEQSVFNAMSVRATWTQMMAGGVANNNIALLSSLRRGGASNNPTIISDPEVEEMLKQINLNYDLPKIGKLYTTPTATRPNFITYINEQVWLIPLPTQYTYVFWQPWLKGYGGAINVSTWGNTTWPPYVWIDQELKKAMGR